MTNWVRFFKSAFARYLLAHHHLASSHSRAAAIPQAMRFHVGIIT
jgi:hypothetical protein